ncbi:MAG: M14 family metallopeptidase [Bacteroidetes bacterium]|nr:M14 family metallopeptidase [Bacteroidota bacterium]
MKNIFVYCFFFVVFSTDSQDTAFITKYEKSGGTETANFSETIEYCHHLDEASPRITYRGFGKSARGKELPLLIADKDGLKDPAAIRSAGRIVLLIQACIHPGECEGKDAGLMLLRDLALNDKNTGLLNHVSILFIPVFNVDGFERFGPYNRINQNGPKEMGWRVNANNLNLNRDYLKAETPEMQAWLQLFNQWDPDFFIDTHTTDGADYQYVLTYGMETTGDMDPGLSSWSNDIFMKELNDGMTKDGFPVFPYIDFRDWHNPESGLVTEVSPPMLSQGYTSSRNRPGLLIETHMLKPYDIRVRATYEYLKKSLAILNEEYLTLKSLEKKADEMVASENFRKYDFPLHFNLSDKDSIMVDFLGMEYEKITSEITGEIYFKYGTKRKTYHLSSFSKSIPSAFVKLPEVYIVPVEWKNVIQLLDFHGVKYHLLSKDTMIPVSSYTLKNLKWNANPYEGRHTMTQIETDEITEERLIPSGSAIISLNQPCARVIAYILEPNGNGSYLSWGFFDAVTEQKEHAEHYVMEEIALKMLKDDPALKAEFEKKKVAEPGFAKNPDWILNWFFSKTLYWDKHIDAYPIGKIFDKVIAKRLLEE